MSGALSCLLCPRQIFDTGSQYSSCNAQAAKFKQQDGKAGQAGQGLPNGTHAEAAHKPKKPKVPKAGSNFASKAKAAAAQQQAAQQAQEAGSTKPSKASKAAKRKAAGTDAQQSPPAAAPAAEGAPAAAKSSKASKAAKHKAASTDAPQSTDAAGPSAEATPSASAAAAAVPAASTQAASGHSEPPSGKKAGGRPKSFGDQLGPDGQLPKDAYGDTIYPAAESLVSLSASTCMQACQRFRPVTVLVGCKPGARGHNRTHRHWHDVVQGCCLACQPSCSQEGSCSNQSCSSC